MTRFILKRLLLLPLLLVIFSITAFAIVQAPPGDFLTTYVATLASSGSSHLASSHVREGASGNARCDRPAPPVWNFVVRLGHVVGEAVVA